MFFIRFYVAVWLLTASIVGVRAAEYQLNEIRFEGNENTRDSTLLQEMTIRGGETVTDEAIEESRQAIMDLGLFKAVESELVQAGDAHDLVIRVNEKRFWFLVPKFSRSGEGDIAYGAELQFDNLRGRNQHLEITYKEKDLKSTDVTEESQFEIELRSPRIFGSLWETDFGLLTEESDIDEERNGETGQFQRDHDRLEFDLARWFTTGGPSRGWRISNGFKWETFDHTFLGGNPDLFFDADIMAYLGSVEFVDVHDYLYSREGRTIRYDLELSADALGSDVSYARHGVRYRRYKRITSRPHTNLNFQFRFGYATRSIFGDATYNVAGDRLVRGFDRDSIEGEAFVVANSEFLTPLFGKNALRGALLLDIGNAYPDVDDIDLTELEVGVGVGLRWKIKSFVKLDLRLDFSTGLDGGEQKFYAATRAAF